MKQQIEKSVVKLEFLASVVAYARGGMIDMDGLYTTFTDIIEEIKEALDDVEDRPAYTAANKAA